MSKYVFGIDLGTTYSCIAYVDETGRPVVIKNEEGSNTTPSVVNFSSPTEVCVGQTAKENALMEPEATCMLVKTLIGKTDFAINYAGEDKSPEEVSAFILKKLAKDATAMIGSEVKDVVITCPAYFGTAEREATKNAGEIAGLNVLEIINEPDAAALFYGCTREQNEKTILIFDLGGGTFDVTIMNITSDKIEVVCSDGNHELGGKDWDETLMRYLGEQFVEETGFDGEFDDYDQQQLRLKAEEAKKQLTGRSEVKVMLPIKGFTARMTLTREKFDELTETLLNEAINKTDAAIQIAKDKGYNKIDEILLVGGSTRMPQVTRAIKEKYAMEPKILEPDEAVAKGAAIHAVNVYVNHQKNIFENAGNQSGSGKEPSESDKETYKEKLEVNPEMMSIGGKTRKIVVTTTKSFAIQVLVNDEPVCRNLIIKNEPMPDGAIKVSKVFGTYSDNQENVELVVYETDFMEEIFAIDDDFVLGTVLLELDGTLPAGAPIRITFILNTEGILEVEGYDETRGNKVKVTMQAKGIMSKEEVEEKKEKSKHIQII